MKTCFRITYAIVVYLCIGRRVKACFPPLDLKRFLKITTDQFAVKVPSENKVADESKLRETCLIIP